VEYAWLAPVLCAGAFFFNVLIARQLGSFKHALSAFVAVAAIAGAFAVFVYVFGDALANLGHPGETEMPRQLLFDNQTWFSIGQWDFFATMSVDWLSIMMLGVVTFLGAFIQVYSLGYLRGDDRFWWFFAVMSLFCAAMLGLVLAYDFLLLYMCWELVGLCSYLLIGFWYQERDNAEAAKKAFVTTRIGDVGLGIGIILLFLQANTFRMDVIFEQIASGRMNPAIVTVAGILIFIGAMGKSGQFPLHVWLPDAMAGPTPVSALVHSATMVAAGVFLVARAYPLFAASPVTLAVIATIGTITLFFAATIALTQRDIKRVLAYSTVSQLGYMMMALGVGAYTAGVFHLYTHAFFKALLFLGAGSVIHSLEGVFGHRNPQANDIFNMGGLRRRMPITFFTFLVAALSLAGIFPLSGFWSKDDVLLGALNAGAWVSLVLGLLGAFLTAFYMFRVIYLAFFGEERWREVAAANEARAHEPHEAPEMGSEGHGAPAPHESPWVITLPLVIIAIPAAFAGVVNIPGVWTPFGEAIFFEEVHHAELNLIVAGLGLLAGLLGIGLATIMYWKPIISPAALTNTLPRVYRTLYNKYYFDDLYQWVIDHVVLAVGALSALFDRKVVNQGVVDTPASLTGRFGWVLRFIETGRVYNYAFAFVVGILIIGLYLSGVLPIF
jgi:NADH-quinone oxidoreductase subunit L